MAPRSSPDLAVTCDQEKQKGNANRATLALTRKLVAHRLAVISGYRSLHGANGAT
jgi:transposase